MPVNIDFGPGPMAPVAVAASVVANPLRVEVKSPASEQADVVDSQSAEALIVFAIRSSNLRDEIECCGGPEVVSWMGLRCTCEQKRRVRGLNQLLKLARKRRTKRTERSHDRNPHVH